jgi:hypothetical protein
MKLIPLIRTKEIGKTKQIADIYASLNKKDGAITSAYLLDEGGIKKNQPSLSLYQYTQRWFNTIVDAGCQHVGDVVDVLLAGADIVVIRPNLWREPDFLSVRDISESKLYVWYDPLEKEKDTAFASALITKADGLIVYTDHLSTALPFEVRDKIKGLISTHPAEEILLFDSFQTHERELSTYGLNSMIVDLSRIVGGKDEYLWIRKPNRY